MGIDVGHRDEGFIEMLFPATVEVDAIYEAVAEARALSEQHACRRFLVDTRALAQTGDSFDILQLAEFLSSLPPRSIEREAILPPLTAGPAQDFAFFETAARNRGLNVRLFDSRESAVAWLTG